jgi:tetratricopeptide (TPR) repeat protein
MQQLLNQYQKINYLNVAEILRDQKGMDNSDIGMCNEKAVNQLIAHHSIIFKPEQLLVWVSSAPFQLGEYVCYDLNKIFDESADYKSPIKIDSLKIAPDAFLYSDAYKQSQIYRKGVIEISQAMSDEKEVSEPYLQKFEQSNPQFFHIYKVLGDYYASKNQNAKALETYKKALKCEFPRLVDQTDIETRINDLMKEAK